MNSLQTEQDFTLPIDKQIQNPLPILHVFRARGRVMIPYAFARLRQPSKLAAKETMEWQWHGAHCLKDGHTPIGRERD